jgi:large subunit ribosomal protein L25
VIAEALHLPSELEASIEGLEAGSHITAGDVKLPKGVELAVDADVVLAVINAAQSNEEAPAEGETPAEGESAE